MAEFQARDIMRGDFMRLSIDEKLDTAIDTVIRESSRLDTPEIAAVLDNENKRFVGLFPLRAALGPLIKKDLAAMEVRNVEDLVVYGVPVVSPTDGFAALLEKVVASPEDATPVLHHGQLLGMVFLGDIFDRIAEEALVVSAKAFLDE